MSVERLSFGEWAAEQPPLVQWFVAQLGVAALAYFAAMAPIWLAGWWTQDVATSAVAMVAILMFVGTLGTVFRRHYLVATIFWIISVVIFSFGTWMNEPLKYWMYWWPAFFFPPVALFLQAWLLSSYYRWGRTYEA